MLRPEYSADYIEGFNAGRASAELVCGEQHAFLEDEIDQLRTLLAINGIEADTAGSSDR